MSDISDKEFLLGNDYYNNRRKSSNLKNFSAEFQRRNSSKCLPSFLKRRRSFRSLAFGIIFLFLILVLTMFYFDPNLKTFRRNNIEKVVQHRHLAEENSDILESSQFVGYESILQDNFSFNINGSDVMVFLHIQKTGGTTFGKHLVQDIDLEAPCICHRKAGKKRNPKKPAKKMLRCECFRPNSVQSNWLFFPVQHRLEMRPSCWLDGTDRVCRWLPKQQRGQQSSTVLLRFHSQRSGG